MYRQLLEAEKLADSLLGAPSSGFKVMTTDFNKDGRDEIAVEASGYHALFEPAKGGSLIELDYLKKPINLSDTLTRRPEAYHQKLLAMRDGGSSNTGVASIHDQVRTKEPGLENKLFYDQGTRASLVERMVPLETKVEDLLAARYRELGDFHRRTFAAKLREPKGKGKPLALGLACDGSIDGAPVKLTKDLTLSPGNFQLDADYRLLNLSSRDLRFLFLVEWNLTLLAGDTPDRNYFVAGKTLSSPRLNTVGAEEGVSEMGMRDGWLELEVNFKTQTPAKFWRYPVETISQSEGGFERVYQGSCLLLGWEVHLPAQGSFETSVTTSLKEIKRK
jgi:alpha-amylase